MSEERSGSERRVRSDLMFVRVRPQAKETFVETAHAMGLKPSEAMRLAMGEWVGRHRKMS